MYMKNINWLNVIWQSIKAFGPAIIAWALAVYTSHRNSSKEWDKMLTQLELTKDNNIQVQNKAYKLQFCLGQLEQLAQMYEEEISRINIVVNTVQRFLGLDKHNHDRNIMVIKTAQEAMIQLHMIMMHNGSLVSVIEAISSNHKEFDKLQDKLKSESKEAEATLHFLNTELSNKIPAQKFLEQYNEITLVAFNKTLAETHVYLMQQISELFKEMG